MPAKDQLQSVTLPILCFCSLISEMFMLSEAYGQPLGTDQQHVCQKEWRRVYCMGKARGTNATQIGQNNHGTTAVSVMWRPPKCTLVTDVLTESYWWKAVCEQIVKQRSFGLWSFYKFLEVCTKDLLILVFSKTSVSPSSDPFCFTLLFFHEVKDSCGKTNSGC